MMLVLVLWKVGSTVLIMAAMNGDVEIVELLKKAGADINAKKHARLFHCMWFLSFLIVAHLLFS